MHQYGAERKRDFAIDTHLACLKSLGTQEIC